MILEVYSNAPLQWEPRDYTQSYHKKGWGWPMKPDGLWVSVQGEMDWPSFCKSEDYEVQHLTHRHIVTLANDAAIKIISGEEQLIDFDREWGAEWVMKTGYKSHRIDWPRLADQWDGIIIAPYVWSCRLPMEKGPRSRVSEWYYPWDCASGCIWNAEAIKSVELADITSVEDIKRGMEEAA